MKKLPTGEELQKEVKKLGISQAEIGDNDSLLQHRILEAKRDIRESRLWIIALVSAIGSVTSAIAAWYAVLFRQRLFCIFS